MRKVYLRADPEIALVAERFFAVNGLQTLPAGNESGTAAGSADLPVVDIAAGPAGVRLRYHRADQRPVQIEVPGHPPGSVAEAASRLLLHVDCTESPAQWSSRPDCERLLDARSPGGALNLAHEPHDWVFASPFVTRLAGTHHAALIHYVLDHRPVVLKPWRLVAERNYWNSTLNGGLPLIRKRDPIHEGTFMVHDLHHFLFVDPIVTGTTAAHRMAYVAARMLSESITLVLADIAAVYAADLTAAGYDVGKRAIYPVFASLNRPLTYELERDLVFANARFALTGELDGFVALGVPDAPLERFADKYRRFFAGDYTWNLANVGALASPAGVAYADWVSGVLPELPTTSDLVGRYASGNEFRVADFVEDEFLGVVYAARRTTNPRHRLCRERMVHSRTLAGQAKLLFDLPRADSDTVLSAVERALRDIEAAAEPETVAVCAAEARALIDDQIDALLDESRILSHEAVLFRSHYPHFPPVYVDYDRPLAEFPTLAELRLEVFGDTRLAGLK
ncbi:hypothetical protein [Actinoplanes utahensis]|uniref:Uncharacterized protein n=1 Tax=Actinoplanes utahensis TaxID=1869 RepID=A0A0A6U9K1_ACTUT|nr:hypothetical protein [Actinoplanes utahensis]KHD72076.1 hypothetical protein MB27_42295 [Actinoplanes utahensis]GIF28819.1 hypothetical protein Aut01nite_18050 [Actinoplanes utahensis]